MTDPNQPDPRIDTNNASITRSDVRITLPDVTYRPVPDPDDGTAPTWRVRFELASDVTKAFGLAINGEIILGRALKAEDNYVDLDTYGAEQLGVSRRHAMLRPTINQLFLLDLNSTNGTYRNGHNIGSRTPFGINNGDEISFGNLRFIVRIIERPSLGDTTTLLRKASLADALSATAKAITSQLDLDAVLSQVAHSALTVINASEVGVWLIDQDSKILFLEAQWGMHDRQVQRKRVEGSSDSLAMKCVNTGRPVRAVRKPGDIDPFKKDSDLEEGAMLFVPVTLASEVLGVISARHRDTARPFAERDEKVLSAIADFTAIALQNARIHQVTDEALARRVDELAAINELSNAVTSSLDLNKVHTVLMEQIARQWNIEAAALWLVDVETGQLAPFDGAEFTPASVIGEGVLGRVAETGQAAIVTDVDRSADFVPSVDTTSGIKTYNMVAVPLVMTDDVVGVLALFNKAEGRFDERDIERLEAFAKPVSTAVENARLFTESARARAAVEYERAIVNATIQALPQPLIIFREDGEIIMANEAAHLILETSMPQEIERLKIGVGETTEFLVGEQTYITTSEQVPYVGTIVVMQNITYVKQLERTRTELLHGLSHDLKSPISSIKGWLELIDTVGITHERAPEFLEKIGWSSERMLEMVSELMKTARSGVIPRDGDNPCLLEDLVNSALSDLQGAALAKSTELAVEIANEPYPIFGDCNHLYRCVLNLVDNAIKYAPEGSRVTVTLVYDEETVRVRVRDDGDGIPEDDLPHLFERGYRGVQEEGDQIGTGLGLATVKNIVESHGGKIRVRNHPDGGAEFTIILGGAKAE